MAIDIFTPEVMDAVVRVMPPQPAFFKNTFFKGAPKTEPTIDVRVDFFKGKRRVAPFVSDKAKAKVSEKIGYASDKFTTPLVKVKDTTGIEDIMKRLPGELLQSGLNPDERAVQLLAQTLADFDEQITRREEVMIAQALFTGKIPVVGEGVNYEIDFNFTNTETLTGTALWDNASSVADPIADLKAWSVTCMQNGYRKPNICVMDRSAYAAFIDRCKALGYFNQWNFLDLNIQPSVANDNVTFCGRLRDPNLEIYIYDEWYLDDWTTPGTVIEKPMVPKGKILLASTNAKTSLYYGILTFADENAKTLRSVMATRAADSWIEKEPPSRFITLNSRPLPVIHEVDSWFVATVSATS